MNKTENGRWLVPDCNRPSIEGIVTADLAHVCRAHFGAGRPHWFSPKSKWTGSSFKYDIYTGTVRCFNVIALRWANGAGSGWLLEDDKRESGVSSMLLTIAANPNEPQRWDGCHFIWNVVEHQNQAGAEAKFKEMSQAHVDGRLKKRKHRGSGEYRVTIQQPAELF